MRSNRFSRLAVAVTTLALVFGVATPARSADATKDIVDTAVQAGSFTTLAKALTAAGLVDTLKGPGPFTVFAPTDGAFAKLPRAPWRRSSPTRPCSRRCSRTTSSPAPSWPPTW